MWWYTSFTYKYEKKIVLCGLLCPKYGCIYETMEKNQWIVSNLWTAQYSWFKGLFLCLYLWKRIINVCTSLNTRNSGIINNETYLFFDWKSNNFTNNSCFPHIWYHRSIMYIQIIFILTMHKGMTFVYEVEKEKWPVAVLIFHNI